MTFSFACRVALTPVGGAVAALATTPWPLSANLTTTGCSVSIAHVSPAFVFMCDPDAACYPEVSVRCERRGAKP